MFKRLLFFSLTCLLFISCSDDPSSFTSEPPELPPTASMDIDMSSLTGSSSPKMMDKQSADYYVQAVFRAGFLKRIIDTQLLIPKNLLKAVEDTAAQLNEDQQWEWNYQYLANTNSFSVRLVAERVAASTLNWSFFVTSDQLGLQNHLLFSGTTENEGTKGVWAYNSLRDSTGQDKLSTINWNVAEEDSVHLRLDILTDLTVQSGSYIDYTFEGQTKTLVFYNAGKDETTTIHWNVETRAGYFIAPDINGGEKACWDENQENTPCEDTSS